ncbi:MAG: T9SS type A sorting domain-containing protein [candidate division Zixibacteria bacterium]|nr:T9SS type A sorting domain-containing protein [candidate division Zixibacteria bacterium]
MKLIVTVFIIWGIFISSLASAHSDSTGYSGAPGSNGTCASSCHGTGGGTMGVTGFPAEYVPEETYIITISHAAGNSIAQFNASCRIGIDSENAGIISSGANTDTYSTTNETNGARFVVGNLDLGTFEWTAPEAGIGDVRLYVAGMQGNDENGQNNALILLSTEGSSSDVDEDRVPGLFAELSNYPNPFNSNTLIEFSYEHDKPSGVHLGIFNLTGQLIYSRYIYCNKPKIYNAMWNGINDDGLEVPSGVYFYRIESKYGVRTNKMVLMK